MKRINRVIIVLFTLIMSLIGINVLKAQTESIRVSHVISGYFYEQSLDKTIVDRFKYITRDSDGAWAYCIQPFKHLIDGTNYQIIGSDFLNYTDIPKENWERISKIAYYGYGYKNDEMGINHSDIKWYVATQQMIWKLYNDDITSNFTVYLRGPVDNTILSQEINEINHLVDNHDTLPLFKNMKSTLLLNDNLKLVDDNNVLYNYQITDVSGGDVIKEGNSININATKTGKISFTLINNSDYFNENMSLYYSPDSQNVMRGGKISPVKVTYNIDVISGKVNLIKTSADKNIGEASLEGAVYGIYNDINRLITTLTTDAFGKATSAGLPLGKYYIKEISSPSGYTIDENKYFFNIDYENKVVTLNVNENVIKGRIVINKIDSETMRCSSQGEASLTNNVFIIKDKEDNIVDTISTNTDCKAISGYLPYGIYKVFEEAASEGYNKNNNIYTIIIDKNSDYEITIDNDVIKNNITILKLYNEENNSSSLKSESNITFEIYDSLKNKYSEIITDINGYASVLLPYGKYTFHQVNTKEGYDKIEDFNVIVDESSLKQQYYNLVNNRLSAYLMLQKIDSETNEIIRQSDAVFKIFNVDTNEYVSEYIGGKYYDTFITDENGIMTTSMKLNYGNYKIIEMTSPKGYLLDEKGVEITIGEDSVVHDSNLGNYTLINYYNDPVKGQIEVNKKGELFTPNTGSFKYDEINLDGVKIEIYAEEDITSYDKQHIYYYKNELVDILITSNGHAISKALPLGKYKVREVETITDYILDNKEYYINLFEENNASPLIVKTLDLKNNLIKGTLELTKTDSLTKESIEGALFEIYTDENELVFVGATNKNGKLNVENLKIGKYYVVEREAPEGYIINNEKTYFEIKDENELVNVFITNDSVKEIREFNINEMIVEVPNTGVYSLRKITLIILINMLIGVIYLIYGSIKKKK